MLGKKPAAKGKLIERVVIGIFGNKQHGKDTFAGLIDKHIRYDLQKKTKGLAIADPVKHTTMALTGMPIEVAAPSDYNKPVGEDTNALRLAWTWKGRNGREWLQWVGTELGRDQIDQDIWVDRVVETVVADIYGTHYFLISDCRFHTERISLRLKLKGRFIKFLAVRIHRPGEPVDLGHPSESEVASMPDTMFEHVIVNDGGLAQLEHKAREFVANLESVEV